MAIALVTGTSSGIGLATAVALARGGHTVAATLRNLDGGAEIRRVAEEEKLPIHLAALDVDDDASVREAFARVVAQLGPIDVLVNNAGVPGGGPVEETTLDQFRQVMETNFFGGLRCIKAVIPSMRERRKGTIVNITSIAGRWLARRWRAAQRRMGLRGAERVPRPGGARLQRARRHRGARSHCHADLHRKHSTANAQFLPAWAAASRPVRRRARQTRSTLRGRRRRSGHVDGDSWQLRYLVGPDTELRLKARQSKTDEQVIAEAAQSDDEFLARIKRESGLDLVL